MMDGKSHKPPKETVEYSFGGKGYQDAGAYDEVRYRGPANEYKQRVMSNAYNSLIQPLQGKTVLDIGCGTGRGAQEFARDSSSVVGVDFSFDMLVVASGKNTPEANCKFIRAMAQKLPFPENSFDVVTTLNFLHLFRLDVQRQMVKEMIRVAKPGGSILLEFDNALHGIIVGPLKRWLGRERGSLPNEIRYVIGWECRVDSVSGAVFPVLWRALYRFGRYAEGFERLGYVRPFNILFHRLYYKLVKSHRI